MAGVDKDHARSLNSPAAASAVGIFDWKKSHMPGKVISHSHLLRRAHTSASLLPLLSNIK